MHHSSSQNLIKESEQALEEFLLSSEFMAPIIEVATRECPESLDEDRHYSLRTLIVQKLLAKVAAEQFNIGTPDGPLF